MFRVLCAHLEDGVVFVQNRRVRSRGADVTDTARASRQLHRALRAHRVTGKREIEIRKDKVVCVEGGRKRGCTHEG